MLLVVLPSAGAVQQPAHREAQRDQEAGQHHGPPLNEPQVQEKVWAAQGRGGEGRMGPMAGALCALGEQQQQAGGALLALLMPACFIHTAQRHLPAKLRWFGRYIMPGRRSSRRSPTTTTRVRVRRTM